MDTIESLKNSLQNAIRKNLARKLRGRKVLGIEIDESNENCHYPNRIAIKLSGGKLLVINAPYSALDMYVNNDISDSKANKKTAY